jgi:hypothetical protein
MIASIAAPKPLAYYGPADIKAIAKALETRAYRERPTRTAAARHQLGTVDVREPLHDGRDPVGDRFLQFGWAPRSIGGLDPLASCYVVSKTVSSARSGSTEPVLVVCRDRFGFRTGQRQQHRGDHSSPIATASAMDQHRTFRIGDRRDSNLRPSGYEPVWPRPTGPSR